VTCLRHAAIVEAQKSVNTLGNSRVGGVYSVPFRAAGGRAESNRTVHCYTIGRDDVTRQYAHFQGNAVVYTVTTQQSKRQEWNIGV
jgi:hypothetical protein